MLIMSTVAFWWPILAKAHEEAYHQYVNELDRAGYFDRPTRRSSGWSFTVTLGPNRR
jgi:hypothetical protein